MHSGENRKLFARSKVVPPATAEKILDGASFDLYNAVMEKYIRKVSKSAGHFQVSIPRNIILSKRWGDVSHVLIEDSGQDYITIRRLVDGKSLKTDD